MEPENFQVMFRRLETEVQKVIVGHGDLIRKVLIAFFAGGHVLLEGVPGLGKTLLVKSLSHALGMSFKRIQFTPDLMPSDIVGTEVLTENIGRREILKRTTGTESDDATKVLPEDSGKLVNEMNQLLRQVMIAPPIEDYVVRLVHATQNDAQNGGQPNGYVKQYIRFGSSPRGAQS